MKKITVIGVGYVGLVTGTCLAEMGNEVIGVDIDRKRIDDLNHGVIPIYEQGLEELVKGNIKNGRLTFTTDVSGAVRESEIVFIAVGTPPMFDGSVNLEYVRSAAKSVGENMNGYKVIVNKSTVPIGTGDVVSRIIEEKYNGEFDVVSNPEFLREGTAVSDFMNPDRVVIGTSSTKAEKIMCDLYSNFGTENMVVTDVKTAEMIKYASNSFLATEISFINSIANLCEKLGADVEKVSQGMMLDKRIGQKAFLHAGVGYGGSCFPKDVKGLIQIAQENNVRFGILEEVENTNNAQKQSLLGKIQKLVGQDLRGKNIVLWGLAFKPHTDDVREAPALVVIKQLLDRGVNIRVFDPIAQKQAEKILGESVFYESNLEDSVKNSDCLVILTEWPEFKVVDLDKVKKKMNEANVVDGRNIFDPNEMKKKGFKYISVGR
ncbi:MAG: UDP-glucose/GDP-mannose dehydrogenase family protein [Candidatus Shapirobacteria bacterium]|nr:UDP-glucose/GDP-mannose dehydrogenase family protein [Candidatus Shapirobacteria bacterium]